MDINTVIPLFPLSIAVLPGQIIPLHIFEERYKQLMNDCLGLESPENPDISISKEFGVNYSSEDGLAAIGCSLTIVKVLKRFKDGRLDILAEGKRRFRLCEILEGKTYQQGKIEFISEAEDANTQPIGDQGFIDLHKEMCVVAGIKSSLKSGTPLISYQSACAVGLDDYQRQTLLELASERDRIVWLTDIYQNILHEIKTGKNSFYNGILSDIMSGKDPGMQQIH